MEKDKANAALAPTRLNPTPEATTSEETSLMHEIVPYVAPKGDKKQGTDVDLPLVPIPLPFHSTQDTPRHKEKATKDELGQKASGELSLSKDGSKEDKSKDNRKDNCNTSSEIVPPLALVAKGYKPYTPILQNNASSEEMIKEDYNSLIPNLILTKEDKLRIQSSCNSMQEKPTIQMQTGNANQHHNALPHIKPILKRPKDANSPQVGSARKVSFV